MNIFIVDDDCLTFDLIGEYLEGMGHNVESFTTAEGALYKFKQNKADLVISDVFFPSKTMQGDSMAHEMLRLKPDLKVLFIAGLDNPENVRRLEEMGEYLHKSYLMQTGIQKINELLG